MQTSPGRGNFRSGLARNHEQRRLAPPITTGGGTAYLRRVIALRDQGFGSDR
jgi:hypothetical protein